MTVCLSGQYLSGLNRDAAGCVVYFLGPKDRRAFEETSKLNRKFIKEEYPKYEKDLAKRKELTPFQKLELEFIKFQDRPVWQRASIVALCLVGSPAILTYHSPKLLRSFYISVIKPCSKAIKNVAETLAIKTYNHVLAPLGRFTHDYVLAPLGKAIRKVAIFTYDYAIYPVCKAIYRIAKFTFVTCPVHFYRSVCLPLARGAQRVCTLVNNHVLTPLVQKIKSVFQGGLVRLLRALYTYVLVPAARAAFDGLTFVYDRALVPVAKVIRVLAKGLFITFPKKVWQHVIAPPLRWTWNTILVPVGNQAWKVMTFLFQNVVIPMAKILRVVLKGVCITFPYKIYVHLLTPIGRAVQFICRFTYDVILTPIGRAIQSVASAIFNHLIVPLSNAIKFGANVLHGYVIVPVSSGMKLGATILYESVLAPSRMLIHRFLGV